MYRMLSGEFLAIQKQNFSILLLPEAQKISLPFEGGEVSEVVHSNSDSIVLMHRFIQNESDKTVFGSPLRRMGLCDFGEITILLRACSRAIIEVCEPLQHSFSHHLVTEKVTRE